MARKSKTKSDDTGDQQAADDSPYEYDIAFSFLARDESLVTELAQKLDGRFSTFLYSKKQEHLAGRDGEEAFGSVFQAEARIVVILYRSDWGQTPWTRIEETAVRNRAFDEGYDFTLFIHLEPGAAAPRWLPKNRLWFGFERYGVTGALSVIEVRVQEAGGQTRPESFEESTKRISREIESEQARKTFLNSYAGVAAAKNEITLLHEQIRIKSAIAKDSGLDMAVLCRGHAAGLIFEQWSMSLDWHGQYANSLNDSYMEFRLWEGPPPTFTDRFYFDKPRQLARRVFDFDRQLGELLGWREKQTDAPFMVTEQFAELCIGQLMEKVRSEKHERPG